MFSNFSGYNSWHREQQHSQPARTSQVSMTKHRLKEKDFPNPWQYLRLQTLSQTQVLLALRSPRWKQQASHFGRCLPRNRPSLRYKPAGPISHCSLSLSLPPISHFMSFTFSSITSFHYTHASPLSSPLFKNDFFNPLSIYSWHRIRWQMKWTTDWRWHLWIFSWQKHVSLLKLGFEGVGRLWREVWWDHTGWARDELCWDGQGGRWSNPVGSLDFFAAGRCLDGVGRGPGRQAAHLPLWQPTRRIPADSVIFPSSCRKPAPAHPKIKMFSTICIL